ncbi:MAG: hypothetical protein KDE28_27265, partial [Anaerolineales bacterium]|nr:hypothetical protein [Anaerolineales bacterium]
SGANDYETRWLRIAASAPLVLGDRSGIGNFKGTLDHIPARMIMGALAHRQGDSGDDIFAGDQPVIIGNGYPERAGATWPLPLTARECKRYPGWESDGGRHNRDHGVYDLLFAELANGLLTDPEAPARDIILADWPLDEISWRRNPKIDFASCPWPAAGKREPCGEALDIANGYYSLIDEATVVPVDSPTVTRRTHVGINRRRNVAEDALLFSQESVEPTQFLAEIRLPQVRLAQLETLITGTHYLGRGRSRGQGAVQMELTRAEDSGPLAERLDRFRSSTNAALNLLAGRPGPGITGQLFSLTLRTPAILGRPGEQLRVPAPAQLGIPDALFVAAWARTTIVGGWNIGAGQPQRTRQASRQGSVFVFYVPAGALDETALLARLSELEHTGLGYETADGYGRVTVCASFHVIKDRLFS